TLPAARRMRCPSSSNSWTSFLLRWARARDGREVVDIRGCGLAVGERRVQPTQLIALKMPRRLFTAEASVDSCVRIGRLSVRDRLIGGEMLPKPLACLFDSCFG